MSMLTSANETVGVGPARLDLRLYAGDGFNVAFVFTNAETGAPYPLEGEWAAQVRAPASNTTELLAFVVNTTEAATGKVVLTLTGEQTRQLLGVVDASWDLQQTPPAGQPRTWYAGAVTATLDVTR